jgi:hypothetical protein
MTPDEPQLTLDQRVDALEKFPVFKGRIVGPNAFPKASGMRIVGPNAFPKASGILPRYAS